MPTKERSGIISLYIFTLIISLVRTTAITGTRPLIDPDTPSNERSTLRFHDNQKLTLTFSDEFSQDGRGFAPGEDDFLEALHRPDDTNSAIQFYNSSKRFVTTEGGSLLLITRAEYATYQLWNEANEQYDTLTMNYTSAMIQSWNKFCFTGGVIEVGVQLPGDGNTSGLWPALWMMGNLGRAVKKKVLAEPAYIHTRAHTLTHFTSRLTTSSFLGVPKLLTIFVALEHPRLPGRLQQDRTAAQRLPRCPWLRTKPQPGMISPYIYHLTLYLSPLLYHSLGPRSTGDRYF